MRIRQIDITPVAFHDPPLLNSVGVHQPFAIRSIVEVQTSDGVSGLGETSADSAHLAQLRKASDALLGLDLYALNEGRERVAAVLGGKVRTDRHGLTGPISVQGNVDRVFSPFEVALLDIQGKIAGRPISDLLGGAVRDRVPFSAYLFYKLAGHPGQESDDWGAALDPAGIVAQAKRMVGEFGFSAIKLKGGVHPPDDEIEAVRALRSTFPDHPLRLDPNAAWSVATSVHVGNALADTLEYLEDPTSGVDGMAQVAARVPQPLATNMIAVSFEHIPPVVEKKAAQIILSDHHLWGGLTRSRHLAALCETFELGLSMHSNSHLGVSLAAMTHLAAATPNLTYACDTHWPWKRADEDVVLPGTFRFEDGCLPVPTAPGLGVELDRDGLSRLHELYITAGIKDRDDTGYMRSIDPSYRAVLPRW